MKIKKNMKTLLILALVVLLSSNQNIAQNVGIGSTSFTPDASAGLEIRYTDKGFLPPRMTTEQRDKIPNPATGLLIFNTTTNCVEVFIPPIWQNMYCGCTVPNPSTAVTHTPGETQIVWNWNSVAGADGYKYNTVNDFAIATDNGTSTTYTQEGLDCETEYTLYVWAYNACGNSTVLTLTQTTSACPFVCGTSTITFTYNGESVTYGTVTSSNKCWLDRNLGASQVATSSTDELSYGDLFQWGRAADGHQLITWTAWNAGTPVNSNTPGTCDAVDTDTPTHSHFIKCNSGTKDWRNPQNPNLWQGVSGANNPCPSGWRVPTKAELDSELSSWDPNYNAIGAINSPLKLPLVGFRGFSDGVLAFTGSIGFYWSSSVEDTISRYLYMHSGGASSQKDFRSYGFSIRCVKD